MVKTEVRWIVRVYTAYELVHIKSRCIENWAAPGVEVVTLTDHKQALAEKDTEIQTLELQQAKAALNEEAAKVLLASCKEKDREIERLHRREQSLLERIKAAKDVKDREIQQIREREFQAGLNEGMANLYDVEEKYQQLMEQAIEWAKEWQNPTGYPSQTAAYRFLQSDEVKAFLKERDLEADPFGDAMKQFYKERMYDSKG